MGGRTLPVQVPALRVRSAELAEHVLAAGRVLGEILDQDLAAIKDKPDVVQPAPWP
jgi:hypothetical protein